MRKNILNLVIAVFCAILFTNCEENVIKKITINSINLSSKTLTLYEGQSATLTINVLPKEITDTTVKWSSENEKIATVSDKGVIKALTAGVVNIVVTSNLNSNFYEKCELTVKKIIFLPKLTDLQKNNLKGNIKEVLDSSDFSLIEYNQNGFITKNTFVTKIKEISLITTFEYNSFNLITKTINNTDIYGVKYIETRTFIYDNNNLLLSSETDSSGTKTFITNCENINKVSNCVVKNARNNILFQKYTINYNDDYSLKDKTSYNYYSDGITLENIEVTTYNKYDLFTKQEKKDKNGNILQTLEITYNYYYQILTSNYNDLIMNYIYLQSYTYDDKSEILVLYRSTTNGKVQDKYFSKYFSDDNGNWISRYDEYEIYENKTKTRTIKYY